MRFACAFCVIELWHDYDKTMKRQKSRIKKWWAFLFIRAFLYDFFILLFITLETVRRRGFMVVRYGRLNLKYFWKKVAHPLDLLYLLENNLTIIKIYKIPTKNLFYLLLKSFNIFCTYLQWEKNKKKLINNFNEI